MLANIGTLLLIVLWGVLFIANMVCIAKNKIDAETGVLWGVIIGGLQICIAFINVNWAELLNSSSIWIIEIEQFLLTCILYNHGIEATEMRKKNNELAIQLALLKEQMKSLEEEDPSAKQ